MDKKKIFIAIHYLEVGGAEISLIGLLQSLNYSMYDVDLFVYSHRGELMEYIPEQVNLLEEKGCYPYLEAPVTKTIAHGHIGLALRRLYAKLRYAKYRRSHSCHDDFPLHYIIADTVLGALPQIGRKEGYDLAISYLNPHAIVLKKVKAAKKACWIHTDFSKVGVDAAMEEGVWGAFDHIVSISADVTKGFLKVFPALENKIVEMKNILPEAFVRERAGGVDEESVLKEMPRQDGVVNLLSVGRFCYAKNYDNVPDICRRILEAGCRVCWYLIGFGSDLQLIESKIKESGTQDCVKILGKKSNPYPYMKACDVYVQPSRYEGNAVTVREAQMLGRPVIITAYPTAGSQVADGRDGFIVPLDNKGCADGIVSLLKDPQRLRQMEENLKHGDFSNRNQTEIIEKLFE